MRIKSNSPIFFLSMNARARSSSPFPFYCLFIIILRAKTICGSDTTSNGDQFFCVSRYYSIYTAHKKLITNLPAFTSHPWYVGASSAMCGWPLARPIWPDQFALNRWAFTHWMIRTTTASSHSNTNTRICDIVNNIIISALNCCPLV